MRRILHRIKSWRNALRGRFMKSIRMEVRVKNNRLWRLIHESFTSEVDAAEKIGVGIGCLNAAINLRCYPYHYAKYDELRADRKKSAVLLSWAEKICNFFEKDPEWLFPPELYTNNKRKIAIIEADRPDFVGLPSAEKVLQISEESEVETEAEKNFPTGLDKAMDTIPDRCRKVLIMRHGLDGELPLTLEETAKKLRVTPERVRQIESKATRFLRHPSRVELIRS